MRLIECEPGDIIVLDRDGEDRFFKVNSFLGKVDKKSRPHSAMCELVDPDTLKAYMRVNHLVGDREFNMFCIPDCEILDRVRRVLGHSSLVDDGEGDPLMR
jgi:hypothetical protein